MNWPVILQSVTAVALGMIAAVLVIALFSGRPALSLNIKTQGAVLPERFWLFSIAAASLAVLGVMVFVLGFTDKQVNEMLFGSLITGLLMIVQKVIDAGQIRDAVQKLGDSTPREPKATGKPDDPIHVDTHAEQEARP